MLNDVFGSKPEGGGSGSWFQGPTQFTQDSCDAGTVWENPITQVEKIIVTLVNPGIWVHQSKLQGTANGPIENAAGEAKRRGAPPVTYPWGLTQPLGMGVANGPGRCGEQRSHLSEQGVTELVLQKSSQRAAMAILLSH